MKMPILNKKHVFYLAVVTIAVLLQSCATENIKFKKQEQVQTKIKQLKNIKVVHQNAVWPTFKTPMGVLASTLTFGISEDWSVGKKLVHKFKIKDPGLQVKEKFLMQVNKGSKIAIFNNDKQSLTHEESTINEMKAKYKRGFLLKFHSYWWEIWYYPSNFSRYQMWFQTKAELIRLNDSKVLWKGDCRADQADIETAPTLDELIADNSAVLQKWIDDSTSQCAKQLVKDFPDNF